MFVICNVRKDLAVRMKQLIKPQMRKNLKSEIGLIRICLMIMKCYILNVFCILFFRVEVQRNFLKKIERQFAKNERTKTSKLSAKFISIKDKAKGNIKSTLWKCPIMHQNSSYFKLEFGENQFKHLVLIQLPTHCGQFKVRYNTCCERDFLANKIKEG